MFGPPAVWDRPREMPLLDEIAGMYSERSRTLDRSFQGPKARVELNRDGTMRVRSLPYEQMTGTPCEISGTGTWYRSNDGEDFDLHLVAPEGTGACPVGDYGGFAVAGRKPPFSLYWIVSDPDSGTGVWLASNR